MNFDLSHALRWMTTTLLLFAGAGCSPSTSPKDSQSVSLSGAKPIQIGLSFQELDNPYFVVMKESAEEAARSIGAELHITDARHDVTKQISDVEDLVQKGIDILPIPSASKLPCKRRTRQELSSLLSTLKRRNRSTASWVRRTMMRDDWPVKHSPRR